MIEYGHDKQGGRKYFEKSLTFSLTQTVFVLFLIHEASKHPLAPAHPRVVPA